MLLTDVNRTPSLTTSDYSSADSASIPPSPTRSLHLPRPHKSSFHRLPSVHRSKRLASTRSLQSTLKHRGVLSNFLLHCSPDDFRILTYTCQDFRHIFRYPALKDIVLAHFISGYRSCLQYRDSRQFVDVNVTVSDLQLFLISEKVGLHVYPMHALTLMSIFPPSEKQQLMSTKLFELAEAHSRFVLLLQSLAHSSSSPIDEIDDFVWRPVIPPGIKELEFPAPLSYHELDITESAVIPVYEGGRSHRQARTVVSADYAIDPTRPRKRRTIFNAFKSPPPPPSVDPVALRQYSEGWRRTLRSPSWRVDDFGSLKLPRRRFVSPSHSRDSSLSGVSPSSTIIRSTLGRDRPPISRAASPHDFNMACSRTHAPVLRVFVPCSELDEASIATCMEHLMDSGLWSHLSTGDIVCNLGYVPPTDRPNSGNQWLIFNGFSLVSYSPPDPPPIDNALTLPSPFYYSHILPPFSNPVYILNLSPHLSPNIYKPHFELTSILTKVKSPHSPGGFAMVKQYKWLVSLRGSKAGVGNAWQSKWVLEGEGTTEGREILNRLISGEEIYDSWLWEIDRDRSSRSRLWLRLLGHSSTFAEMDRTIEPTGTHARTTSFLRR